MDKVPRISPLNSDALITSMLRCGTWGCAGIDFVVTRDRARKNATRTAADGSYARAARIAKDRPVILASDAQRQMISAFDAAGWPVESDGFAEGGQWAGYPGPLWSLMSRPGQENRDTDPHDADRVDLTDVPEFTFNAPRISSNTGEAMVHRVPATISPADLVAEVSAALAQRSAAHGDETPSSGPAGHAVQRGLEVQAVGGRILAERRQTVLRALHAVKRGKPVTDGGGRRPGERPRHTLRNTCGEVERGHGRPGTALLEGHEAIHVAAGHANRLTSSRSARTPASASTGAALS
ncbi:hypothetical protein AB0I39_27185 [Kitasatospora purpeofusca]|uniref:hypothetical protein n=1 Tax=Kitasatospora purpeofusca TaxID=67352 RepID=UPI0033E6CEED